jgi:hypothetical protein
VAYFLRSAGENANGTPRYTLYRRQRLAVVDNVALNWTNQIQVAGNLDTYAELSCNANGNNIYFNSQMDLTVPERRFGMTTAANSGGTLVSASGSYPIFGDNAPPGQNANLQGADILLTDVISFEVKVLASGGGDFVDVYGLGNSNNPNFKASGPMVFDTWSSVKDSLADYSGWATPNQPTSLPIQASIKAIKITIRIWDLKSQTSRQITMVQDL